MKIYLEVYGCTANKSDESIIKGILKENNYKIVKDINDADVIVILTCTVIDTTEQRMISKLKKFQKIKKRVIVTGCMASVQSDAVLSVLPTAELLPPQYVHHIIDVLENKYISFKKKNNMATKEQ